jgi:hypothetical protein
MSAWTAYLPWGGVGGGQRSTLPSVADEPPAAVEDADKQYVDEDSGSVAMFHPRPRPAECSVGWRRANGLCTLHLALR